MNKDSFVCKCGTTNPFSKFVLLSPYNKVVQVCLVCKRKVVIQNYRVIEWGKKENV